MSNSQQRQAEQVVPAVKPPSVNILPYIEAWLRHDEHLDVDRSELNEWLKKEYPELEGPTRLLILDCFSACGIGREEHQWGTVYGHYMSGIDISHQDIINGGAE